MTQDYVAIEIDATMGGTDYTGRFEMLPSDAGAFSYTQEGRTGYLVEGAFSSIASIVSDALGEDDENRRSINLDFGGGQHAVTVEAQTPGDATKSNGDVYQWGSSSDPAVGPNEHTATGADPLSQLQVFIQYWRVASPDSLTPARFSYGQYSPSGFLDDHLKVALESPTVSQDNTSPSVNDLSVTMIEMQTLDGLIDAQEAKST